MIALTITIWLLCGLIPCGFLFRDQLRRTESITIGDLLIGSVIIMFGPMMLVGFIIAKIVDWVNDNYNVVVFEKKAPKI